MPGILEAVDAGIACGLAGVEGGLNPIADAGCAVATGLMLGNEKKEDEPVASPVPTLDLPADSEETTIKSSSTSQDDPPPAPPG